MLPEPLLVHIDTRARSARTWCPAAPQKITVLLHGLASVNMNKLADVVTHETCFRNSKKGFKRPEESPPPKLDRSGPPKLTGEPKRGQKKL